MVFSCVQVIRGFILTKEDVCKIKNVDPTNEDDFFVMCDEYLRDKFLCGYYLYTWPCCSELNNKKFIVGKIIAEYDIVEMFNKEVIENHQSNFDFDFGMKELAEEFGSSGPHNYLILDDCTYCT